MWRSPRLWGIFYHSVKQTVSNICATNLGLTFEAGGVLAGYAGARRGENSERAKRDASPVRWWWIERRYFCALIHWAMLESKSPALNERSI